ncbi:hypothetical protein L1987_34353 [Smallanthus sonchifolius]|uniref:Uncharacterized protein n=1 Tax=Smallanthus sonchifolius TaxID=185202 RepID=A0ACB9HUF6_9ASTR|nr:hypothetical protein L1987_34353 [Smallanthus sonchifolius]
MLSIIFWYFLAYSVLNALFLEPTSQSEQQFAKSAAERSHMDELRLKCYVLRKKEPKACSLAVVKVNQGPRNNLEKE